MFVSRHSRPARIALGLFLAAALAACGGDSPATETADVQFALGSGDSRLASALAAASVPPAAVVLSVETQAGVVVHDMLRLDVYSFGPTHVSQRVQLPVGRYRLTQFLVVDAQNETIYAAPNVENPSADPELVGGVWTPLPIEFNVTPGVLHSQPVEVLPVAGRSPQQFGYTAFTFRISAGPKTATRVNYGPGWDDIYFTEDDEVASYSYVEFSDHGETLTDRWLGADGRGPDQIWFTEDDVPSGWWWQHDDEGYGANHGGPGADGIWVSDDDPITSWEEFDARIENVGAEGPWHFNALYTDAGPDGTWRTADDVLGGYLKRLLNGNGAELRRIRYVSPGWDGVWYTFDDEIGQDWFGAYVVNTYPAGHSKWGSWMRQVSYSDPGWDYEWLTADDVPSLCRRHDFGDGTEYWTRETVTAPGYDGSCFTTDDSVVGYSLATNVY